MCSFMVQLAAEVDAVRDDFADDMRPSGEWTQLTVHNNTQNKPLFRYCFPFIPHPLYRQLFFIVSNSLPSLAIPSHSIPVPCLRIKFHN